MSINASSPSNNPAVINPTQSFYPDSRMTSREIAELTGKNHHDVLRDIRNLVDQEAIHESNFALVNYNDSGGKPRPMYSLDFQATMVLVTGYDAKVEAALKRRKR